MIMLLFICFCGSIIASVFENVIGFKNPKIYFLLGVVVGSILATEMIKIS